MIYLLRVIGWILCCVYATVPLFWLMIHPLADRWRSRRTSPYRVLLPTWTALWILFTGLTFHWREGALYSEWWMWIPAGLLFSLGMWLYVSSGNTFSLAQLAGLPELQSGNVEHRLVTVGIRSRIRHPIYAAHFCEMLAWSLGTGLATCYMLTIFAAASGAAMIQAEDKELSRRFGQTYAAYRERVPAIFPELRPR